MDKIVGPLKYQTNLVYFVGIIVYPRDFDIRMTHMQVLTAIGPAGLRLKAKNYTFIIRKMNHLGHQITAGGYFPEWKLCLPPRCLERLRFLLRVAYTGFFVVCKPLPRRGQREVFRVNNDHDRGYTCWNPNQR